MKLDQNTKHWFNKIESFLGDISLEIKPISKKKTQKLHVILLM